MPKKPAPNAFFFYMQDYKREREACGEKFKNGMKDVSIACADLWKNLPKQQKAKYEALAKEEKLKRKDDLTQKFTPSGESFDEIIRKQQEEKMTEERERSEVKKLIKLKTFTNKKGILDHTFYVIDVNYYCKHNDNYIPCEIGIVAFSLQEGIQNEYHKIITPAGGIPLGYMSDAKDSFKVHNIGLPETDGDDSEYVNIISSIYDFMDFLEDEDKSTLPPVFTMPSQVEAVSSVLMQMCDLTRSSHYFNVYRLDFLFYTLKNALKNNDSEGFPKESLAQVELKKYIFEYNTELTCDYHKDKDAFHNCVLNKTKNWAYIILDHCCQLVGVPLVKGNHVPSNVDEHGTDNLKQKNDQKFSTSNLAWHDPYADRSTPLATASQGNYLTRSTREPKTEVFAGVPMKMSLGRGRSTKPLNEGMKDMKIGEQRK